MPPLTPADGDHSTRETPNRSSGFALGEKEAAPHLFELFSEIRYTVP